MSTDFRGETLQKISENIFYTNYSTFPIKWKFDKMEISSKHCKFANLQKMEIVHENADFSGKTDFWKHFVKMEIR